MPVPDGGDGRLPLPDGVSPGFERAIKFYDMEDYHAAAPEFWTVVQGRTGDREDTRVRAAFFLGKSLYNLHLYLPSLSCFRRSAMGPNAGSYHWKALQWLESLARVLPEESGWDEVIASYSSTTLDAPLLEPVRDLIGFRGGLITLRQGKEIAIALRWLAFIHEGDAALASDRAREWPVLAAASAARCDWDAAGKHLAAFRRQSKPKPSLDAPPDYRDEIRREREAVKKLEVLMKGTDLLARLQMDLTARERRAEADTARRIARDRGQQAAFDAFERSLERLIADGKAGKAELASPCSGRR